MLIKHPKGRQMDAFDWFIGDGLILARCRVPTSLIRRVNKKGFIEEDGYRRGIQNFFLRFFSSEFPFFHL